MTLQKIFRVHFHNPAEARITRIMTEYRQALREHGGEVSPSPVTPKVPPKADAPARADADEALQQEARDAVGYVDLDVPPFVTPGLRPLPKGIKPPRLPATKAAARGAAAKKAWSVPFVPPVPPPPVPEDADADGYQRVRKKRAPNGVMPVGIIEEENARKEIAKQYDVSALNNILNMTKTLGVAELWADSGCRKGVGGAKAHAEVQALQETWSCTCQAGQDLSLCIWQW